MTDKAAGASEAGDATVAVVAGPDSDAEERAARKAETSVAFKQRQIEWADANVESAERQVEKAEAALEGAQTALTEAHRQREELG